MKSTTADYRSEIIASPRDIYARARVYDSTNTQIHDFTDGGAIQSLSIDCPSVDGKFFGYAMSQTIKLVLVDSWDSENVSWTINDLDVGQKVVVTISTVSQAQPFCNFFITEVQRDIKTGAITVTATDALQFASDSISKIDISQAEYLSDYASLIKTYLGLSGIFFDGAVNTTVNFSNPNYSGEETIRTFIEDIAEASGTICFVDSSNRLVFKSMLQGDILAISKATYFDFSCDEPVVNTGVAHTNALENTIAYYPSGVDFDSGYGTVLYENVFLSSTNLTDATIQTCLSAIYWAIPQQIKPFKISWRGNPALEPVDIIRVEQKADELYEDFYYIGYHLSYTGGLSDDNSWTKKEPEKLDTKPNKSISDAIRVTEARVDKANQEIILKVSKNDVINQINLSTEGIQINANKINLTGYLTATDVGSTGTTVIDGGRIQTGTISAVDIDIGNGNFTVDQHGNMLCNDAIITGKATFNGEVVTSQDMASNFCTITNLSADRIDVSGGIYAGGVSMDTGGGVIDTTRQITVSLAVTRHGTSTIALNFSMSQALYRKQPFYVRLSYINWQGLNYYFDCTTEVPAGRTTWTSTYEVQDRLTNYFTVREFYPVNIPDGDSWSAPVLTQSHYSALPHWSVTGAVVPSQDNAYALGTALQRWKNINVASFNGAPMPTASGRYVLKVTASAGGVTYQWEAL